MQQHQQYEYASFWRRTGATLVDTALFLVVTIPLLIAIYGGDFYHTKNGVYAGLADVLLQWVFPVVATLLFWKFKQATPGKMAMSVIIVDAKTGERPTTGQLIGRYLAYFVSMLPLCLGFFWVVFDKRKQGWHDKLAGTAVVRRHKAPMQVERTAHSAY